ncbi:MAG: FG-GAP-like repeat-containing protein, partial [Bacteroidota bacterium]|nr:FG-GAP-like repeat-containing protein [Bacteroidota bacterium]
MTSHRTPALLLVLPVLLAGGACAGIASAQMGFEFTNSGQALGDSDSMSVALGDLDGDGDLDAMVANAGFRGAPNTVWMTDGTGTFTDSGQALGQGSSYAVALGDLDGDGDLDAFVTNTGQQNTVWINDGTGLFTDSGQRIGNKPAGKGYSWGVALGDLDGDGDLDAMVVDSNAVEAMCGNTVWTNDGKGVFTDSGQQLGTSCSASVALGDLDGDGDLDAMVANRFSPDRIWMNDGTGTFTNSGQAIGKGNSTSVALGDLDGDGDLDAMVANGIASDPNTVWINDGTGILTNSGQTLGNSRGRGVALGDFDGDGDLDAMAANYGQPDTVWTNDGTGTFTNSGQAL